MTVLNISSSTKCSPHQIPFLSLIQMPADYKESIQTSSSLPQFISHLTSIGNNVIRILILKLDNPRLSVFYSKTKELYTILNDIHPDVIITSYLIAEMVITYFNLQAAILLTDGRKLIIAIHKFNYAIWAEQTDKTIEVSKEIFLRIIFIMKRIYPTPLLLTISIFIDLFKIFSEFSLKCAQLHYIEIAGTFPILCIHLFNFKNAPIFNIK